MITGMSGTGKSTALEALGRRGDQTVDTDDTGWIVEIGTDHGVEPMWDFDAVVLSSAPVAAILARVIGRANPFGPDTRDRVTIANDLAELRPRLRPGAGREVLMTLTLEQVVAAMEQVPTHPEHEPTSASSQTKVGR